MRVSDQHFTALQSEARFILRSGSSVPDRYFSGFVDYLLLHPSFVTSPDYVALLIKLKSVSPSPYLCVRGTWFCYPRTSDRSLFHELFLEVGSCAQFRNRTYTHEPLPWDTTEDEIIPRKPSPIYSAPGADRDAPATSYSTPCSEFGGDSDKESCLSSLGDTFAWLSQLESLPAPGDV